MSNSSSSSSFAIISVDPTAAYEWNRYAVRSLFSGADLDLKELAGKGLTKGDYLVRVSVSVEVLEAHFKQEPEEPEIIQLERDYAQDIVF